MLKYKTYIILSPKNFNGLKLHERDSLQFMCKRCKKKVYLKHVDLHRLNLYKLMLCRNCMQKYTKKRIYGNENYNNRDKFRKTAAKIVKN